MKKKQENRVNYVTSDKYHKLSSGRGRISKKYLIFSEYYYFWKDNGRVEEGNNGRMERKEKKKKKEKMESNYQIAYNI